MFFRAILVAFFILANSFFVAAEFALISVRETRMEQLLAMGRPGARTALQLKRNIDEFLPAVQFGVTLASLALGWLGEPAVAAMLLDIASRWMTVHWLAVVYAHTVAIVIANWCPSRWRCSVRSASRWRCPGRWMCSSG